MRKTKCYKLVAKWSVSCTTEIYSDTQTKSLQIYSNNICE